jgi:hypothetical protein
MPVKKLPPLSPDVHRLLVALLGDLKISASQPEFDQAAALIAKARDELATHAP